MTSLNNLTEQQVIDECHTFISRIEGAFSCLADERVCDLEQKINDWLELTQDFMEELNRYRKEYYGDKK